MTAKEDVGQSPTRLQLLQRVICDYPLNKLQTVGELYALFRMLDRLTPALELDLNALEEGLKRLQK